MLFECDLYANIRSKLVRALNNTMGKIDCNLEIGQRTHLNMLLGQLVYKIFQNIYSRYNQTVKTESYLEPIAAGINQNTLVNPQGASYHATINPLLRQDNLTSHNLNNTLTLDGTKNQFLQYLHIAISSFVSNCFKNHDAFLEV